MYAYAGSSPFIYTDFEGLEPGKGERGYSADAGGSPNPSKHWKDDPNKPGWGWQKDPQTGKKTYKKRPPYIPAPPTDDKSEKSCESCSTGSGAPIGLAAVVGGVCVVGIACIVSGGGVCIAALGLGAAAGAAAQ